MLTIFKHRSLVGQDTLRLPWVICANILHLHNSVTKRKRKASIDLYVDSNSFITAIYTFLYLFFNERYVVCDKMKFFCSKGGTQF